MHCDLLSAFACVRYWVAFQCKLLKMKLYFVCKYAQVFYYLKTFSFKNLYFIFTQNLHACYSREVL